MINNRLINNPLDQIDDKKMTAGSEKNGYYSVCPFLQEEVYKKLLETLPDIEFYEPKFMNTEGSHLEGQERYHLWLNPYRSAPFPSHRIMAQIIE